MLKGIDGNDNAAFVSACLLLSFGYVEDVTMSVYPEETFALPHQQLAANVRLAAAVVRGSTLSARSSFLTSVLAPQAEEAFVLLAGERCRTKHSFVEALYTVVEDFAAGKETFGGNAEATENMIGLLRQLKRNSRSFGLDGALRPRSPLLVRLRF